ncbi:hypothetical protein [Taibaiella koreensis]|uniref:hypothetical protein n=1 Tax=Taibaiella koreensis TaxID=1268548 RepID=UPI000E599094|nr:hypothetical protein [Taibaiella koreensis]
MAKLFIFIPFEENEVDKSKDLPEQAIEFAGTFAKMSNKRIGENIDAEIREGIEVVYLDSDFTVSAADYIIVFAHGSKNTAGKLYSNDPQLSVATSIVIDQLKEAQAQRAQKILFMCCFSALAGHVAAAWKGEYRNQVVYGGDAAISNLYSATRTQIRACCKALFQL